MLNTFFDRKGRPVTPSLIVFKCFTALVAGVLICFGGESQSAIELIQLPGFTLALVVSTVIAFIAIEHVSYSTKRLHQRFPVYDSDFIKINFQFLNCFLSPFLVIFTLASVYYACHGIFILNTMWLTNHGWQIFIMLVLLNLTFLIIDILQPKRLANNNLIKVDFLLTKDILLVNHENGINIAYYDDGSCAYVTSSLKKLIKGMDLKLFIPNPQNCIIRCDNIMEAWDTPKRKVMIELISPPGKLVTVSARQRPLYLAYFKIDGRGS